MKKVICILMTVLMLIGSMSVLAFAEESLESITVYVSIANDKGLLALAQEPIKVTDVDKDGALTVNDALYSAHEAKYEGGAAAGYESAPSQWGISLNKLWGVANGGSYGYYINNNSAMSLTDTVKDGDYLNAYAYTDLSTWSDMYCYFDAYKLSGDAGAPVTLTLTASTYDAQFNPITVPVADAVITVDGISTTYKTDTEGKVTFNIGNAGVRVISAKSQKQTLVPPVCILTVEAVNVPNSETQTAANTATSDNDAKGCGSTVALVSVGAVAFVGALAVVFGRKKKNEQ